MDKKAEVERIEKEAVAARLQPGDLCDISGVARSSWWRARQDPDRLSLKMLGKLEVGIAKAKARAAAQVEGA